MRHDRLVKAIEKAGYEIKKNTWDSTHHYAETGSRILSWYQQNDSAICVNSRRHNDHHDSQSDYSAGYFCHTIKEAVASLSK